MKWWSKLGHGKHVIESLIDKAKHLDQADPLSGIRRQFVLNDGEVYLDGNSLGALPKLVRDRLAQTIDHEWGHRQIRSWNESWIDLPQQAARKVANIVGAPADDVIFADSVSINLFKLMAAAVYTLPNRPKILSAKDMFPTDLYIAQGLKQLLGERRCDVELCDFRELQAHLSDQVSVVVLSQVNFRTGEAYDIERVTQLVHRCGARIIWDVSHSVGVLPINLQANQGRLRCRLRVQIFKRWSWSTGIRLRSSGSARSIGSTLIRLDGPQKSLCIRQSIRARCWCEPITVRYSEHLEPGFIRCCSRSVSKYRIACGIQQGTSACSVLH